MLIIIGAGVSGLTAGVYAQKNGIESVVFEKNPLPGGQLTGWKRGGFFFDGCVHWLTGSKKGTGLRGIWEDTGALDDSVNILPYDVFSVAEGGGEKVRFFTDTALLRAELLRVSPEDRRLINSFCDDIERAKGFSFPVDKPYDLMGLVGGVAYAAKNLSKISAITKYSRLTVSAFAAKFKSPLIRSAINSMMCPVGINADSLVFTLAGMGSGDCGYPEGGSLSMAERMAAKYELLGGKIHYSSPVREILVKDGRATGVLTESGKAYKADFVLSCADAGHTFSRLLKGKYQDSKLNKYLSAPEKYYTPSSVTVFLGVEKEVDFGAHAMGIEKDYGFFAKKEGTDAVLLSYHGKRHMAPEGKDVLALFYLSDYEAWQSLERTSPEYKKKKELITAAAIECARERLGLDPSLISVTDCVTPLTYKRWCNSYRGAWMSFGSGKIPRFLSGKVKGLSGFLYAGMWTQPPGGLPLAAAAGKFAVQRILKQRKK